MNNQFIQGTYCSYCGHRFTEQKIWPRKCFFCYNDSFKNPLPVVAGLIPVIGTERSETGLLIGKRGTAPGIGQWALIGGYIELNEQYNKAIVREVQEEIGLNTDYNDWYLFDAETTSEHILLFSVYTNGEIKLSDIPFVPNQEVLELGVTYGDVELAFPTHRRAVSKYIHYV